MEKFSKYDRLQKLWYVYWVCSLGYQMYDSVFTDYYNKYCKLDVFSREDLRKEFTYKNAPKFDEFDGILENAINNMMVEKANNIIKWNWWKARKEYYSKMQPIEGESTINYDNGQYKLII